MLLYNMNDNCIQKLFINKMAIIDQLKIIEDKYIIAAGIDSKIRIWNIDTEKVISKFQVHQYLVKHMCVQKEFIYSFGYDMKLAKFDFKNK